MPRSAGLLLSESILRLRLVWTVPFGWLFAPGIADVTTSGCRNHDESKRERSSVVATDRALLVMIQPHHSIHQILEFCCP